MSVSKKQLAANRNNAPKGGAKTPEGRAVVKYNALKHGLLAKETVITVGDGAENPEEFNRLLQDLNEQLKPEGILEEMLVEKIAAAYWRLRRAYAYEVGLIKQELDTAEDDFYGRTDWDGDKPNKMDEEIDAELRKNEAEINNWEKCCKRLSCMRSGVKPLEDTFELDDPWEWLHDKYSYLLPHDADGEPTIWGSDKLREFLNNNANWSDDDIWAALIAVCEEKVKEYKDEVAGLTKQKEKNRLKLQVIRKLGNIPSRDELDRLLRYEGVIERQFCKALNQLERLQRLRAGDNVPAPVQLEVDMDSGQGD
ncbi:MAG: hypothetical protein ACYTBJ_06495 [Planctomycetota bacterium]|jgi:hypothetical protein